MWYDDFFTDKTANDAKQKLIKEYLKSVKKLKYKDSSAPSEITEDLLNRFKEVRGGGLVFPYVGTGKGYGCLVELSDGSVKYDMIGGIGVNYFGHGNEKIVEASLNSAISDCVMQGNLQQNEESLEVMEKFKQVANLHGAKLDHVFLTTSGAMAVENGIKMAFQRKHPADRILAFANCFHGRTTGVSQITDKPYYREGLPDTLKVDYIPFNAESAVKHLEKHIARHPGKHSCMVAELIQGEGGFNVGDKKILQDIANCLKKHDILFFVDEVQSFARTYKPFAFQMFELDEYVDLVCVGKSTQVCATIFKEDVKPRPGLVSQTFTGATSSLFAADVVLTEILKGKFYDKKSKTGPELYKIGKNHKYFNLFESGLKNSEFVSNIGGIGAMFAFQVFDGSPDVTMKFVHELFKNGVISFIAGKNPTKVRFLFPTPVMSKKDIDAVVKITLDTLIQFNHDRSADK